jgi:hypothetical protein
MIRDLPYTNIYVDRGKFKEKIPNAFSETLYAKNIQNNIIKTYPHNLVFLRLGYFFLIILIIFVILAFVRKLYMK